MVGATEIQWALEPLPTVDPLTLSDEDIIVTTICEADSYRRLAQQAIHQIRALQRELEDLRRRHARLHDDYRRLRSDAA